jgi:hypothetical protein
MSLHKIDTPTDRSLSALTEVPRIGEETTEPDPETVQRGLASAVRLYISALDEEPDLSPLSARNPLTATEIAIVTLRLLRCGKIELFDLAMWEAGNRV